MERRKRDFSLSPREIEVASLVAQGLTNTEVATELGIAPRTAQIHFGKVLLKAGLRNRTEFAVWWTKRNGLAS